MAMSAFAKKLRLPEEPQFIDPKDRGIRKVKMSKFTEETRVGLVNHIRQVLDGVNRESCLFIDVFHRDEWCDCCDQLNNAIYAIKDNFRSAIELGEHGLVESYDEFRLWTKMYLIQFQTTIKESHYTGKVFPLEEKQQFRNCCDRMAAVLDKGLEGAPKLEFKKSQMTTNDPIKEEIKEPVNEPISDWDKDWGDW